MSIAAEVVAAAAAEVPVALAMLVMLAIDIDIDIDIVELEGWCRVLNPGPVRSVEARCFNEDRQRQRAHLETGFLKVIEKTFQNSFKGRSRLI